MLTVKPYNRQFVYIYAANGHLREIRYFIILQVLAATVQVLYHNVFMQGAVK